MTTILITNILHTCSSPLWKRCVVDMAGGCSVVEGWGTSWYRWRLVLKTARLGPRSSETCSSANLKGQRLIQISFRKGFKRPQKDLVHDYPPKRNHCLPGVCCCILFYQYRQLLRCIWNKYKMSIPRRHGSLPQCLSLKFSNSGCMYECIGNHLRRKTLPGKCT